MIKYLILGQKMDYKLLLKVCLKDFIWNHTRWL